MSISTSILWRTGFQVHHCKGLRPADCRAWHQSMPRWSHRQPHDTPNPYCSIIGSTQPGRLAKQFGGERVVNGFSSRFLKVYPDITDMPTWGSDRMPDAIMEQWERIIRFSISRKYSTNSIAASALSVSIIVADSPV